MGSTAARATRLFASLRRCEASATAAGRSDGLSVSSDSFEQVGATAADRSFSMSRRWQALRSCGAGMAVV